MSGNGFGSRGARSQGLWTRGIIEDVPDARALWHATLPSRRADIALGRTSSLRQAAHRPSLAYRVGGRGYVRGVASVEQLASTC
jgi:hypothetical protein